MPGPITAATEPILVETFQTTGGGCRLSFVGLERVGQPLHNLEATAYFSDGAGHEVSSVAGPIQVRLASVSEGVGHLRRNKPLFRPLNCSIDCPILKHAHGVCFPTLGGGVK